MTEEHLVIIIKYNSKKINAKELKNLLYEPLETIHQKIIWWNFWNEDEGEI